MNTYIVSVNLQVEVQAFSEEDALESVEDVFGLGDTCGLNVTEFTVDDHTKL